MKISKNENQIRADAVAAKNGISRRSVYRAGEYYDAIETLVNEYGLDIRDCILNRHVKLSHKEVVHLANCVRQAPEAFIYLGRIIRAGNTKLIRGFIRGD